MEPIAQGLGIATTASSELYPDVELSEEEREAALAQARAKKAWRIEEEQKAEQRRLFEQEVRRPWNAVELARFVVGRMPADYGHPFTVDDSNRAVVNALCDYFTGNPRFESSGPDRSLSKGICLLGSVGTGKTTLMRAFSRNKRQCFNVIPCRRVAAMFAADGHDVIEAFSQLHHEAFGDPRVFYQRQIGYCFDDLGTEEEKKHYGNGVNVMADLILACYDRPEVPFHCRHITTYLTADEVESNYGARVRSRLREMFNMIQLGGEDRRK